MNHATFFISAILLLALSEAAISDDEPQGSLPLSLDNLLGKENDWRVNFGLRYSVSESQESIGSYAELEFADGESVEVPISIGSSQSNTDTAILTLGASYGLTKRSELFFQVSAVGINNRVDFPDGSSTTNSDKQIQSFVLGMNQQISVEGGSPAFIASLESTVVSNISGSNLDAAYFRDISIGFTTFKVIDPVVLSLNGRYTYSRDNAVSESDVRRGDSLYIKPAVSLVINNEITVSANFSSSFRKADRRSNERTGSSRTAISLGFDMDWTLSSKLAFNIGLLTEASGGGAADLVLSGIYKF